MSSENLLESILLSRVLYYGNFLQLVFIKKLFLFKIVYSNGFYVDYQI